MNAVQTHTETKYFRLMDLDHGHLIHKVGADCWIANKPHLQSVSRQFYSAEAAKEEQREWELVICSCVL